MESYGQILKEAREKKELTVEQVERDTSITRQYILGLENEDFDAFPGEPYLVGFLKNYSAYLGVDSGELIKLYHAKRIQESPVPEELLKRSKPKFILPLVVSIVLAAILGTGAYLYFGVFKVPQMLKERALLVAETEKVHQYTFSGKIETHRLYVGDQILVPDGDGKGNAVLTVVSTIGSLTLETPVGPQVIDLSEERELDADGDGRNDFIIYLSDVSTSDEKHGAEVRMLLKDSANENFDLVDTQAEDGEFDEPSKSASVIPTGTGRQVVILEDSRAYPFSLNITFRGPCLFRYRTDRNPYVQNPLKNGDIVNITASNGVRLWASNINALKIQVTAGVNTYDLEVGRAGQVQVEDIKWIREDGKYRLVVVELD